MTLSFGFSPCPNDTFMFEPIVNHRIDLEGLNFEIYMDDVETLNKSALKLIPDITKLSFNAFTKLHDSYQLLHSGCALGRKCGPLIISNKQYPIHELKGKTIAIPGENTTAYFLFKYACPHQVNIIEMPFSEIEASVLSGIVDAGLIIHENRFTYQEKNLLKIIDLGEYWEEKTGCPIPLGGIVINKKQPLEVKQKVNRILHRSVQYAFDNPDSGIHFIKQHAQEMDTNVIYAHIDLYVNEFSKNLGSEGIHAVETLFKISDPNIHPTTLKEIFV